MSRSSFTAGPFAALPVLAALLLAAACGGGTPEEAEAEGATQTAPAMPGATSAGVLEVVDPQDPERPLFRDFGVLTYGETVRFETRFTNTGPEAVDVLGIQPACQCTEILGTHVEGPDGETLPERAPGERLSVPPGADLVLRQRIATEKSEPNLNKLAMVRLRTTSMAQPFITLEIRFVPARRFEFAPGGLRMLAVPQSHGGEGQLKILTRAKTDRTRLLEVLEAPEGLSARLEELEYAGERYWFVYLSVPPLHPLGLVSGQITFRTTDEEGEGDDGRFTVPAVVRVVPDVRVAPELAAFGLVREGQARTVELALEALVPGAKIGVRDTRFEGEPAGALAIELVPETEGADRARSWTLRVTAPDTLEPSDINGLLTVTLDEPFAGGEGAAGNEVRVQVTGRVVARN